MFCLALQVAVFFFLFCNWFPLFLFLPSAGTQSGEEIHIVSCSNIKEFKDSFSNEKFDFRSNVNITFFVYVSNFTWPIKIQVCISGRHRVGGQETFRVICWGCFSTFMCPNRHPMWWLFIRIKHVILNTVNLNSTDCNFISQMCRL